jgi:hypothetical protein
MVVGALLDQDPERRPDANELMTWRPLRSRLATLSRIHPSILADE